MIRKVSDEYRAVLCDNSSLFKVIAKDFIVKPCGDILILTERGEFLSEEYVTVTDEVLDFGSYGKFDPEELTLFAAMNEGHNTFILSEFEN